MSIVRGWQGGERFTPDDAPERVTRRYFPGKVVCGWKLLHKNPRRGPKGGPSKKHGGTWLALCVNCKKVQNHVRPEALLAKLRQGGHTSRGCRACANKPKRKPFLCKTCSSSSNPEDFKNKVHGRRQKTECSKCSLSAKAHGRCGKKHALRLEKRCPCGFRALRRGQKRSGTCG